MSRGCDGASQIGRLVIGYPDAESTSGERRGEAHGVGVCVWFVGSYEVRAFWFVLEVCCMLCKRKRAYVMVYKRASKSKV